MARTFTVLLIAVFIATGLGTLWFAKSPKAQNTLSEAAVRTSLANTRSGSVSGLPIPRFVSLKASEVNVRRGPGRDHPVEFVFLKAGLPVEIIEEFENWRRIRDSEGEVGWVHHRLLSGRRTALIEPWSDGPPLSLLNDDRESSRVMAYLSPRVLINLLECDGEWCLAEHNRIEGFIQQEKLWGIYPGETLE